MWYSLITQILYPKGAKFWDIVRIYYCIFVASSIFKGFSKIMNENEYGLDDNNLSILRDAKIKKGLSYKDISDQTGIPKSTLEKYFFGYRKPKNRSEATKLASILGINVSVLLPTVAASSVIAGAGLGLSIAALLGGLFAKRKNQKEEYDHDISDLKEQLKTLTPEQKEELIALIKDLE